MQLPIFGFYSTFLQCMSPVLTRTRLSLPQIAAVRKTLSWLDVRRRDNTEFAEWTLWKRRDRFAWISPPWCPQT